MATFTNSGAKQSDTVDKTVVRIIIKRSCINLIFLSDPVD